MKRKIVDLFKNIGIQISRYDKSKVIKTASLLSDEYKKLPVHYFSNTKEHTFFGYHDKCPVSKDGTKLLACSTDKFNKETGKVSLKVGYFNLENKNEIRFQKMSETTAWSWQQGCMLQWNPLVPNEEIIFNVKEGQKYAASIFNLEQGKVKKKLSVPVYSISSDGKKALSLQFSRLQKLRPGYGYTHFLDKERTDIIDNTMGLSLVDIETGKTEQLVSLAELADYTDRSSGHYINHATFSPDGMYVSFFHIYHDDEGSRLVRFYLYDLKNKQLKLLEGDWMTSHYCWNNNNEIFSTSLDQGGIRYTLFSVPKKSARDLKLSNIGDIHPMFHPIHQNIIVGDTQPDKKNNQHLFLIDIETSEIVHVGTFFHPEKFNGERRCDLHPRWDTSGNSVIVDTVNTGSRKVAVIDVSSKLGKILS